MSTLLAEARQVRAQLQRRLFHGLGVVERGGIQLISFMPQDATNEQLHKFYSAMSPDGDKGTVRLEKPPQDWGPGVVDMQYRSFISIRTLALPNTEFPASYAVDSCCNLSKPPESIRKPDKVKDSETRKKTEK